MVLNIICSALFWCALLSFSAVSLSLLSKRSLRCTDNNNYLSSYRSYPSYYSSSRGYYSNYYSSSRRYYSIYYSSTPRHYSNYYSSTPSYTTYYSSYPTYPVEGYSYYNTRLSYSSSSCPVSSFSIHFVDF